MPRGGKRPGAGRKPKPRPMTPEEVRTAADRAEGLAGDGADDHEEKRGRGRPSKYQPLFARQAERLVQKGATDAELAQFFEVAPSTLNLWKLEHLEFSDALTRGKAVSDDAVEASLFRRATGYSHDAVKIVTVSDGHAVGSHIEHVPYVEYYPPDTTAAIFWLKNRRPQQWREKPADNGDDAAEVARKIREAMKAIDGVEGRES